MVEWRPPAMKLKPRSKANHNKARTVLRLPDFEYATGTATSKASANSATQTPYANAFMEPILVSAQLWLGYRQCGNYWLMIGFHACRSAHQWLALRMSSIHRAGRSSLLHCRQPADRWNRAASVSPVRNPESSPSRGRMRFLLRWSLKLQSTQRDYR